MRVPVDQLDVYVKRHTVQGVEVPWQPNHEGVFDAATVVDDREERTQVDSILARLVPLIQLSVDFACRWVIVASIVLPLQEGWGCALYAGADPKGPL